MLIARHNRKCALTAVGWLLLSPLGWISAWYFFRYVPAWSLNQFGMVIPTTFVNGIAVACMIALCASAWQVWRRQTSLLDEMVRWDQSRFDHISGGAVAVDYYTTQVTAPAMVVSQIFLLGPLALLRARQCWKRRLYADAESEKRVSAKLAELKNIRKWQGIKDHPCDEIPIFQLALMGLIQYSTKPTLRFKANSND